MTDLAAVAGPVALAGQTFTPQSAGLPRSIQRGGPWTRFEVQHGDTWSGDAGVNPAYRAELCGSVLYPYGQDVWFGYDLTLNVTQPFDAWQVIVGQFHQTKGSGPAPLVLSWNLGHLDIAGAGCDGVNPPVYKVVNSIPNFALGVEHHIVGRLRPGLGGTGEGQVWIDGVKVADASGVSIGYAGDPGVYFKFGIYEKPPTALQGVVAAYRNVTVGPAPLLAP